MYDASTRSAIPLSSCEQLRVIMFFQKLFFVQHLCCVFGILFHVEYHISERYVLVAAEQRCSAGDGLAGAVTARSGKLDRARSRLHRSQMLQVNMRLKALAEIYTKHSFALI